MGRKIFLDIGGWTGKSAEFFLANHPEAKQFKIFTFECDKRNIETIKSKKLPITLIEAAAWTYNGTVKYYYGNDDGGTMYPTKKTGNISPAKSYDVRAVDLAEFIRENFKSDDYIIMKLNCEGAEYELIPHLLAGDLIWWIDKWYVQWHWQKIGLSEANHTRVVNIIGESFEWDCQCNEVTFVNRFKATL